MESEQEALGFQMRDDATRLVDLCNAKDARIAELEAERGAMEDERDDRQALLEAELEAMEAERDGLQESLDESSEVVADLLKKLETQAKEGKQW